MIGILERYRWLRILFGILAIPAGLFLMWAGGRWSLFVTRRVLDLPDTGGHWVEFLAIDLLGVGLFVIGGGVIAASIYSLRITDGFKTWTNGLSPRDRSMAVIAIIAGAGFVILAVVFGVFLLL